MDCRVAEKVMGWGDPWSEPYYSDWRGAGIYMTKECRVRPDVHARGKLPRRLDECLAAFQEVPEYSTRIEHAWRVVERLTKTYTVSLYVTDDECEATVMRLTPDPSEVIEAEAEAKSAPHAICLAALQAVEAQQ